MPITPFNDLRNPNSVNKLTPTLGVTTGTGYAVIVRLKAIALHLITTSLPAIPGIPLPLQPWFDAAIDGSISSIDNPGCQGDPNDPSYTAFISYDDYVNSDMHHIADSYLMWEKGQNILYSHENWDHPYLGVFGTVFFSWEIIEVVDEATYNNGAGVPQGTFISQATYGEIPVGTITANSSDPNSNGASTVYEIMNVPQNQGLDVNNHPGFAGRWAGGSNSTLFYEEPNPAQYNPNITNPVPPGYPGWFSYNYSTPIDPQNPLFTTIGLGTTNGSPSLLWNWTGYTRGFYIGTYAAYAGDANYATQYGSWEDDIFVPIVTEDGTEIGSGMNQAICAPVDACRNPLALNYDTTTTSFYNWLANNPMPNGTMLVPSVGNMMRDYQDDCDGVTFTMNLGVFGDEKCCIFPPGAPMDGCLDINSPSKCGCTDPTAANFNSAATHDCNGVVGTADQSCCEYYYMWKICNTSGVYTGYLGPSHINIGGIPPGTWDANTPTMNLMFMNYYLSLSGNPWTTVSQIPLNTILKLTAADNVSSFCLEYEGPQSDIANNIYPGDGAFWDSLQWAPTPPDLDGSGQLIIPEDCASCVSPAVLNSIALFVSCEPNEDNQYIPLNIINSWASDPLDEQSNANSSNLSFGDAINTSLFGCSNCSTGWLIPGMVVEMNPMNAVGAARCYTFLGFSSTPTDPPPPWPWVEGAGPGTNNFYRVDPTDINQVLSIHDVCEGCGEVCTQICTDPTSSNYVPGPWSINQCDCNGDSIGTNAAGWDSCCEPCDNLCNDPLANNYDPNATGCCGSGPGIGVPTVTCCNGCGSGPIFSGSSASFNDWISTQANGYASVNLSTIEYENMDQVLFGGPIPQGACLGANGGYLYWFGSGFNTWWNCPSAGAGLWNTSVMSWDDYLVNLMTAPCIGGTEFCDIIPGVTATTTHSEAEALMTAYYSVQPATIGCEVTIVPLGNSCECEYTNYGTNYDCCTYNWDCIEGIAEFGNDWPEPDTIKQKSKVLTAWTKKYSNNTDFNPSPLNVWNHTEDIGYVWSGLEYLNISLRYSPLGNLGFNLNTVPGNQGIATGKQPKINQPNTIDNWRFATDLMDNFTGSGAGATSNGIVNWDRDLSKSYYKIKTNMINVAGSFKNPASKIITEPIIGGTKDTGLYHLIIPTGSITIRKGFEAAFPNTSGNEFKTWRLFLESLKADGLPIDLYESNWTVISLWVLEYVKNFNTSNKDKQLSTPEFLESSITYMVKSSDECICIQDPTGPFIDQPQCETLLMIPGSDQANCCGCIYGCMDPTAYNYDPLATCDDGSCIDCDPLIIRKCNVLNSYHYGYLGDIANTLYATCANSDALIAAWGWTSFWDTIYVDYIAANNTDDNPLTQDQQTCYQWVDPNDPDWIAHESSNFVPALFIHTDMALPNPGLNLTLNPWDGFSTGDEACQNCGEIPGCTDPLALNYNVLATIDDGSCEYCVYGCMDATTLVDGFPDINGYDNTAVYDCFASTTVPTSSAVLCPHPCATGYQYNNYNPCATCEDGSCTESNYHLWKECGGNNVILVAPGSVWTDMAAEQWFYDQMDQPNPGETIYVYSEPNKRCFEYIGTIPNPNIYMPISPSVPLMVDWVFGSVNNTSCETCTCIYGCTDPEFCNYDATATCDDGSCCNLTGCLDPAAYNYCPTCCCDGPCEAIVEGCMDIDATNYDPTANTPCAQCCEYIVPGCTDPLAINFDPQATVDDGSCEFLDQCKREIKEFGADPTKKLDVECSFASDVYKEYRKQRYGLSNYCGSDLPDHLHEKELCDWEDSKRPAYLSSTIKVLDTYSYPLIDGEPDWFDPLRPTWTNENCGLSSDVDVDMYFAYDTTSMGIAAIKNQRLAIESWLVDLNSRDIPFGGQIYHTLVFGERWLDWGTSVLTGEWNNSGSCGGVNTGCTPGAADVDHGLCPCTGSASDAVSLINVGNQMSVSNHFWSAVGWGNTTSREWYAAMPDTVTNGSLTHLGFPPPLSKRQVLSVNFADESAAGKIGDGCGPGGMAQPYHIAPGPALFGINTWTQATDGTGTLADGSDSKVTDCWKADYDEWITQYNLHLAKGDGYKVTMVIYPAKPIGALSSSLAQTAFPLHALGGVDSGNNDPQDGRYATGTAPQNDIVDLKRIEEGNPYWDTVNPNQPASHTFGYGGLDNYGWIANVRERSFDAAIFKEDLEKYWDPKRLKCDDSECIVLNVVNQNNVAIPNYDIYLDGGFVGKTDEYGRLLFAIPNASVKTNHILNLCLCLVTEGNCRQQNIKITVHEECAPECCADPTGVNCGDYYTPPGPQVFEGCTDPNASNYNPLATVDDGSCEYCDPAIILTETHVNVSEDGASDGSITITVTNGTLPYTYLWSNGATTQNLTGIPGGLYTLIVTDANGCDSTIVVRINEDPNIYGCMKDDVGYWPNINGVNQAGVNCFYPCSDDGTSSGTPEGYKYFCYDPNATDPDECCEAGCTDNSMINYCPSCNYDCNMEPIGTFNMGWDSCCDGCIYGCMNPAAGNYDPLANCPDNSCIFYWDCEEASWTIDQVTGQGYQLSNLGMTGIFDDSSCQAGNCDTAEFFYALAQYYSSTTPFDSTEPGTELTMLNSIGFASGMGFFWFQNDCPGCNINPSYSCTMPVATIAGYSCEAPSWVGGNPGSCYVAEQVADFGAGHVFASWADFRDWHNNGTSTSNGPNMNCSGSQIPTILAGQDYQSTLDIMTTGPNAGGNQDPFDPSEGDNWIYYVPFIPQCNGYEDCDCIEIREGNTPGTYPTSQLCEDDTETCCGEIIVEEVGGCIDDGNVMYHPDVTTYGATSLQEWWDGQNAAGIAYSQQILCINGIVPYDAVQFGGSGAIGNGNPTSYPIGVGAYNFNPLATFDDGSCCYCAGCREEGNNNYEPQACEIDPSLCDPAGSGLGCTDPNATPGSYDPTATIDDGSCEYIGCLDATATNYGEFEINSAMSYTWAGTTYGFSSLALGCNGCCTYTRSMMGDFACLQTPYATVCFDGLGGLGFQGVDTSGNGGDLSTRNELSKEYQLNQFGNMCQTFSISVSDYTDPQNISYAWSNASPGDLAEDANNFFFWYPYASNSGSGQCSFSQTELDTLYTDTGWTSPAGTGGFQIGSGASYNNTPKPFARPYVIWIAEIHSGTTVLWSRSLNDGSLKWSHVIDELVNNHGFDGNTHPDVSNMDRGALNLLLGSDNYGVDVWTGYVGASCTPGSGMCLPTIGGEYGTCDECDAGSLCRCGCGPPTLV